MEGELTQEWYGKYAAFKPDIHRGQSRYITSWSKSRTTGIEDNPPLSTYIQRYKTRGAKDHTSIHDAEHLANVIQGILFRQPVYQ